MVSRVRKIRWAQLIRYRDESFNSITGLNGSGKSNILDSICFVLGITNMSTVRAQNLQVNITKNPHGVLELRAAGSHLQAWASRRHES
jgi:AAA15 family ATPase/GTPase